MAVKDDVAPPRGQGLERGALRPVAEHVQRDAVEPRFEERPHEHVEPLLRVEPPDRPDAPHRPRGRRQREEPREIDMRRDQRQLALGHPRETAQPVALRRADGDHPVEEGERDREHRAEPPLARDMRVHEGRRVAVLDMHERRRGMPRPQAEEERQVPPGQDHVRDDRVGREPGRPREAARDHHDLVPPEGGHRLRRADVIEEPRHPAGTGVVDEVDDPPHAACPPSARRTSRRPPRASTAAAASVAPVLAGSCSRGWREAASPRAASDSAARPSPSVTARRAR